MLDNDLSGSGTIVHFVAGGIARRRRTCHRRQEARSLIGGIDGKSLVRPLTLLRDLLTDPIVVGSIVLM